MHASACAQGNPHFAPAILDHRARAQMPVLGRISQLLLERAHLIALDAEQLAPLLHTGPETAPVIFIQAEHCAVGGVGQGELRKFARRRITPHQPPGGAKPECAVAGFHDVTNGYVIEQARRDHSRHHARPHLRNATALADPERPIPRHAQSSHLQIPQSVGVKFELVIVPEQQAAGGADPQRALPIRCQRLDGIGTGVHGRRVAEIEHGELHSIETRQPEERAQPEIAIAGLRDPLHAALRQAILDLPLREAVLGDDLHLRRRRSARHHPPAQASDDGHPHRLAERSAPREIRSSKSEMRKKPEGRSPKALVPETVREEQFPAEVQSPVRPSGFGLLSGFGSSEFGVRSHDFVRRIRPSTICFNSSVKPVFSHVASAR